MNIDLEHRFVLLRYVAESPGRAMPPKRKRAQTAERSAASPPQRPASELRSVAAAELGAAPRTEQEEKRVKSEGSVPDMPSGVSIKVESEA